MTCPRPRLLPAARGAAEAFRLCQTQWMHAPMGGPTGLRYEGCMTVLRAAARARGEPTSGAGALLLQMQHVERAVLQARQDQADSKGQ